MQTDTENVRHEHSQGWWYLEMILFEMAIEEECV